jgi:hypothetical protein
MSGLVTAAVLGWAIQASAATLTVYTTDLNNNAMNWFSPGETFLLQVVGDTQGGVDNAIEGTLVWEGALTTTIADPPGCNGSFAFPCTTLTQGNWLPVKGSMFPADGSATPINQLVFGPPQPATNQVSTSIITLVATTLGVTQVVWAARFSISSASTSTTAGSPSPFPRATASRSFRSRGRRP